MTSLSPWVLKTLTLPTPPGIPSQSYCCVRIEVFSGPVATHITRLDIRPVLLCTWPSLSPPGLVTFRLLHLLGVKFLIGSPQLFTGFEGAGPQGVCARVCMFVWGHMYVCMYVYVLLYQVSVAFICMFGVDS